MPTPLALSLGDPAGVGPELIGAAWHARQAQGLAPFMAVGGARLLQAAAATRGIALPVQIITDPAQAADVFPHALPVLGDADGDYTPGAPSRDGALLALASLNHAAALARDGLAGAIVTGPIAKSHLAAVGFAYPGQTECVADACGVAADDAVMMLAGPTLRTVPITVHVALSAVPPMLTSDLILRRAAITAAALERDFGIAAPRLAIAALNPHAGEDGRMGHEDAAIIAPAVERLRAMGIDATGPHPADAMFAPRSRASFDVAICMYHDQALIPLKALDFDNGVNTTLGLPVIRTSPDHGTAFAIAGRGLADPGATIAAIRMAGQCAARRAAQKANA
ncbi:4-hydroxythreonine-4-phosphate dehydrogenase PdxA [Novosphingobium sp. FSY-8]|uniref:4-hydroxythreonine-4-phosphate dehydrogenase n=1 Tax=Novosphingobium ovatum TaxID=1908523 RepID=A0ABW9XAQ2_9SPHN|nr:4-hydroxythreonine-4-phosphate dehydrogenase PdxA [Novosphingobium ovatum]NBC35605.1 4-hydroxythreonine-4-phosphate dehydrogenase PdxA [Novosphingobium ovatum]